MSIASTVAFVIDFVVVPILVGGALILRRIKDNRTEAATTTPQSQIDTEPFQAPQFDGDDARTALIDLSDAPGAATSSSVKTLLLPVALIPWPAYDGPRTLVFDPTSSGDSTQN